MRRAVLAAGALLLAATPLVAASLPSETLWRVEQTCLLNHRTTGFAFPCLKVDPARGVVLLRAPFRETHVVLMPIPRTYGVESPRLGEADAPNYFAEAWASRHDVSDEVARPLGWSDLGLAVNSRLTRSQNQLHIHIDCVKPRVRAMLAGIAPGLPTATWKPDAFDYGDVAYWGRLVDGPSLAGANPFRLMREIPALAHDPGLAVLAVIGVKLAGGRDGFVLLAGRSDPRYAARQSTSEDLLDHRCRPG